MSVRLKTLRSEPIENSARNADCSVIVTDHRRFDYAALIKNARLVVDTPNALKTFSSSNIVRV
jgi:UDP-N-acetyl-D-mannosaminuronate dehydrogenase